MSSRSGVFAAPGARWDAAASGGCGGGGGGGVEVDVEVDVDATGGGATGAGGAAAGTDPRAAIVASYFATSSSRSKTLETSTPASRSAFFISPTDGAVRAAGGCGESRVAGVGVGVGAGAGAGGGAAGGGAGRCGAACDVKKKGSNSGADGFGAFDGGGGVRAGVVNSGVPSRGVGSDGCGRRPSASLRLRRMPSASETSSIFAAIESAALEDAAMTAASTRETRDDDADGNGRPSEDSTTDRVNFCSCALLAE
jgi:hypothetical protein